MRYFLDTSALVKIYHREEGSDQVIEIYEREEVVISELSTVEFLSAVYRKFREGEISERALRAVCDKFDEDLQVRYTLFPFTSFVVEEARYLMRRYGGSRSLRTLDSLQLAFFLVYCDRSEDMFVCADRRLLDVARAEGVRVIDLTGDR
ncbi:hypothetical protein DRP77_12985 [Candidatus Poribacteria bacterium]|nr:MAG: hypothetical protein DRP77_12985 [Candidatus Poribacteria bacterium]